MAEQLINWPAGLALTAARGRWDASVASRHPLHAIRADASPDPLAFRPQDSWALAEFPSVPKCAISFGTNEHGVLQTSFAFAGIDPVTVTPAYELDQITQDYILGLWTWLQDPKDELLGADGEELPDCPFVLEVADYVAIMIPVPADVLAESAHADAPPHITLGYFGLGTKTVECEAIRGVLVAHADELAEASISLGPVAYSKENARVAYSKVLCSPRLYAVREKIVAELRLCGIELQWPGEWLPRLVLGYLGPGENFAGIPPTGTWVPEFEIWHGADRLVTDADGTTWRSDVAANTLAVMLPIPHEIASQFPDMGENGPPHVTMVYVGSGSEADRDAVLAIVDEELAVVAGQPISLGPLDYFDNEKRVAYVSVQVTDEVVAAQTRILECITALGIEVKHKPGPWRPHATLAYLDPGTDYDGPLPEGSWKIGDVEVWYGEDHYAVGKTDARSITYEMDDKERAEIKAANLSESKADKIAEIDGKWVVMSADGSEVLGTYDTEDEANERLRQIEAAKAARADLAPPSEETVKAWLREHISDVRKMSRPRMAELKALEDLYPYLRPPDVAVVYRGLRNIDPAKVDAWPSQSDPVQDKSWSISRDAAEMFAAAQWTRVEPIDGKTGMLIEAKADASLMLGNPELLAAVDGIGDYIHPVWNEPLSKTILDEQEVLVLDALEIVGTTAVEMRIKPELARSDHGPGQWVWQVGECTVHREHFDAGRFDAAGQWIWRTQRDGDVRPLHKRLNGRRFDVGKKHPTEGEPGDRHGCRCYKEPVPMLHAGRKTPTKKQVAAAKRVTVKAKAEALKRNDASPSRSAAVHTESRVHVYETVRADKIELPVDHAPVRHPDGWVLYPVLFSRGGNIQEYDRIKEYRPKGEVFDRMSMDSGIGDPWELRHSSDLLNPDTVGGVARGCIVSVDEYHDNSHTFGWAKAWSSDLLYAIEGDGVTRPEAPEVSVAYRCKIDRRGGHTDDGDWFDQSQFRIIWNSLASEPKGRAGTARVLSARLDADAPRVTSADMMLAIAAGKVPTSPIYYDQSNWTRYDSAASRNPTPKQDRQPMKKLLHMALLHMAEEDLAKAIGVEVADLAPLLAGDTEITPDQVNALVMALPEIDPKKAAAAGADPAAEPEREDMALTKVMIGDAEFEVPAEVADAVKDLAQKLADAGGRADRANKRADAAESEIAKRDVELVERADAMKDMVNRADAQKMAIESALHVGGAMELARRGHGHEWSPEARKDAATGEALPLTVSDWERAAIKSAFGERADSVLARIDAAPTPDAKSYMMLDRLTDARELLDRRDHKGADVLASVASMRANNARLDSDPEYDPLAVANELVKQDAGQQVGTPQTKTNGAA